LAGNLHPDRMGEGLGYGRWLFLEFPEDGGACRTDLDGDRGVEWLCAVDVALPWLAAVLRVVAVRLLPAVPDRVAAGLVHARQVRPGQHHGGAGAGARGLRHRLYHAVLPQLLRERA